jgi:hypothetical protein
MSSCCFEDTPSSGPVRMSIFDFAIVGSGPAAIGTLWALEEKILRGARVAIFSGEKTQNLLPTKSSIKKVHPKVRKEMFEASFQGAVCQFTPLRFLGQEYFLFEAACTGGLSSFWGQQFVRLSANDFVPTPVVDGYDKYEFAFNLVEQRLGFKEASSPEQRELGDGCQMMIGPPRLLEPLTIFSDTFRCASAHAHVFTQRVLRLQKLNNHAFHVICEDGERITSKRIILAAGVLGTARILVNSLPHIFFIPCPGATGTSKHSALTRRT